MIDLATSIATGVYIVGLFASFYLGVFLREEYDKPLGFNLGTLWGVVVAPVLWPLVLLFYAVMLPIVSFIKKQGD